MPDRGENPGVVIIILFVFFIILGIMGSVLIGVDPGWVSGVAAALAEPVIILAVIVAVAFALLGSLR